MSVHHSPLVCRVLGRAFLGVSASLSELWAAAAAAFLAAAAVTFFFPGGRPFCPRAAAVAAAFFLAAAANCAPEGFFLFFAAAAVDFVENFTSESLLSGDVVLDNLEEDRLEADEASLDMLEARFFVLGATFFFDAAEAVAAEAVSADADAALVLALPAFFCGLSLGGLGDALLPFFFLTSVSLSLLALKMLFNLDWSPAAATEPPVFLFPAVENEAAAAFGFEAAAVAAAATP